VAASFDIYQFTQQERQYFHHVVEPLRIKGEQIAENKTAVLKLLLR
jgi:hypothetical protein